MKEKLGLTNKKLVQTAVKGRRQSSQKPRAVEMQVSSDSEKNSVNSN